jgi:hypothetical protein
MFNSRQLVPAVALVLGAACSNAVDLTNPSVIAAELPGTWSETFPIPGSSTVLLLSVSGSTITGTGTYVIEAGASGTLSVTGTIAAQQSGPPVVHLDFPLSDGMTGHFNGTLRSIGSLEGSLFYTTAIISAGDPIEAEFRRTFP